MTLSNKAENMNKLFKEVYEIIDWIFGGKYTCCGFILLQTVLFDETHFFLGHFGT